jgi:hypothetical protein
MPDRERQGVEAGLLNRASPENVLHNLQTIYSQKDNVVYTIEGAHYWVERYGKLFHPDWKWIHVTSVLLDLVEASGQTWRVPSGTADFYFGSAPADTTICVITEWRDGERWIPSSDSDIVSGTQSVHATSWGLIKGMFR